MKKVLLILLLVLLLTLSFCLASCRVDTSDTTTTNNQELPLDPPADRHEHFYYPVITAPTCTVQGYTTYTCECGDSYVGDYVSENGHDFDDWVTVKEPTEYEVGLQERICSCGEKETRSIRNPSVGLSYRWNSSDNTFSVAGIGYCQDTDIVIPDTYKGLPVTSIDDWAFESCTSITSVVIPDSVTSIGYWSFGCSSIKSIEIPNSVTSIGDYAFYLCRSLTSVTIGDSVTTIGESAFASCESLTIVTLGESVTSIANNAFYCARSLTDIIIPNSVKSIGNEAFANCNFLTSVEIPDSVTSIGSKAFENCTSLTNITIGESVSSIGEKAFANSPFITSIDVDINNQHYESIDGNLYSKDRTILIQYAVGKQNKTFSIPDSVTIIGQSAFSCCCSLTSVEIPNSVTTIEEYAFSSCESLTDVVMVDSITIIGNSAFIGCYSLASIEIPNSVISIGEIAFSGCESLTNVVIGSSVTSIGSRAFKDCTSLTSIDVDINNQYYKSVDGNLYSKDGTILIRYSEGKQDTSFTIPSSVTTIGDSAFSGCTSLTSITIFDSMESICNNAIFGCYSLTRINFEGTVEKWQNIKKGIDWKDRTNDSLVIYCTNGEITKNGKVTLY